MDDALSHLRRAHAEAPDDPEAARRLETALRRAGRRQELEALYRLAYRCPLRWDALEGDAFDEVRRCAQCARDVHYVKTRRELARWVAEGACVALDPGTLEETVPVWVETSLTEPARGPGGPCVVEVAPGTAPEVPEGVRGLFTWRHAEPPTEEIDALTDAILDEVDERST